MKVDEHIYDLVIIGSGPAGLSAAVYAGRAMVDTLILEKGAIGGQVTTTKEVVNYPGIPLTTGPELTAQMYEQAQNFDVVKKTGTVESLELEGNIKKIHTKSVTYQARSVLLATGAQPRTIGFEGEAEFTGRGVAYCATCDGEFYKDVPIWVIGGGYQAAEEAVFLTRFASEVHIAIRKGDFRCAASVAEEAKNHPKITVHYYTEVKRVEGDRQVERITLVNNQTGEETVFAAPSMGVFVLAGTIPQTELVKNILPMAEGGYLIVDEQKCTSLPGVYAAGDILVKDLRQIVTAVSDGAIAATEIQKYVAEKRKEEGVEPISPEVVARQRDRLGRANENHALQAKATTTSAAATSGATSRANTGNTGATSQATTHWFDEAMSKQLQMIFAKLTKPVEISLFLDGAAEKTNDMRSFMTEIASLSEQLTIAEYTMESAEAQAYGVERHTTAVLVVDGKPSGIRFSGVPGGHETNSLILALYNLAGPGQEVEPHLVEAIQKLGPTKLQICVSLSCHFCPDVVAACQRMATLNPHIQADMIDAVLYPDLKETYNLMSFPTLVINDGKKILYGAQSMENIIEALTTM